MSEPIRVYVGHDQREEAAYQVCKYSLTRHSSRPVDVRPLKLSRLQHLRWFTRESVTRDGQRFDVQDGKPFSTDFSFTRFLVPMLQNYQGPALFLDCDFLVTGDVAELFRDMDQTKAISCVKHHHEPDETVKMDGQMQTRYRRKNWSSFVLWNCSHEATGRLTLDGVNTRPGSWLHAFEWLDDHEIGALPGDWNYLIGWDKLPYNEVPRGLHFTSGGPWFENAQDVPYADLWRTEHEHMLYATGKLPKAKDDIPYAA